MEDFEKLGAFYLGPARLAWHRGRPNQLDAQLKSETEAIQQSSDPQTEELEKVNLKPTKSNISVKLLSLVWAPQWRDAHGQFTSARE